MFVKSDIRRVIIALESALHHEVCLELGKAGFIHLSRSTDLPEAMKGSWLKQEEAHRKVILSQIVDALRGLDIEPGEPAIGSQRPETGEDEVFLEKINATLRRIENLDTRIRKGLETVRGRLARLDALRSMGINPGSIRPSSLAGMVFGTVDSDWKGITAHESFMVAGAGRYVFGTALSPNIPGLLEFLKAYGFHEESLEFTRYDHERLVRRAGTLERRLETIEYCRMRLKESSGRKLRDLYSAYTGYEEILRALGMSAFSERAMFISGWVDKPDTQKLMAILRKVCGDRFIAVVSDRRDPSAPVRLRNSRMFKPFELLVKLLGMPSNDEIDPTPLTAFTFVLMFGLMFGDLGQGLVLALGGMILRRIAGGRGEPEGNLAQAGGILTVCGLSAALCGLLYGSVFSSEHVMPALWFHPMESIGKLFILTIGMGVLFIVTGLSVNMVNNFMNSRYTEALFEKRGLAICILYASLVFFAVRYALHGQSPRLWEAVVFAAAPLALFSFRGIIGPALFHEHGPESMAEYAVETLVDILEIGLSMLANTVSFIRVGAFALSHAGLSIVTYTLAGMLDPSLRSAGALIVIVAGNIVIIGFEGLICAIQSMRLEFYEFFSKFFRGDGVAFAPFALKAKVLEV